MNEMSIMITIKKLSAFINGMQPYTVCMPIWFHYYYITSSDNADFLKFNCVIAITCNEISHVSQFWIVAVSSVALLFATA